MLEYKYTLNDDDYVEYLASTAATDSKVKVRSLTFTFFIPILTGCIMWVMGVRKLYWFLLLLVLSVGWYFLSQRILGLFFGIKTKDTIEKKGDRKYYPITLEIDKGRYTAITNGRTIRGRIANYTIMNRLIVLFPDNGSAVLVPSRVFEDDPQKLKEFIEELTDQ